jgi:DNA polymerase
LRRFSTAKRHPKGRTEFQAAAEGATLIPMGSERDQALADLAWLVEAGADEALGAAPVDRLAVCPATAAAVAPAAPHAAPPKAPPARSAATAAAEAPPAAPLSSTEEALTTARDLARAAASLEELEAALAGFEGCALKQTAMNLVFADGNPKARVMIIGEGPGAEEDRQAAVGLDRSSAYITNLLFWRPPGNRTPTGTEIAACLPFVERHIELVDPGYLLLVGGISAKTLLGRSQGILKLRGHWAHYQHAGMARPIPAMASLHPAYLLALREALDSGRDPMLCAPAKR